MLYFSNVPSLNIYSFYFFAIFEIFILIIISSFSIILIHHPMKQPEKKAKDPRVVDKKVEDQTVFYLLAKGRTKKWVNFEHMDLQYLELVMEFQKKQESLKQKISKQMENRSTSYSDQKTRKSIENEEQTSNQLVSNIVFLNRIDSQLFFKVHYNNGHSQVMTNKILKVRYPQELIQFYENNIKISLSDDFK